MNVSMQYRESELTVEGDILVKGYHTVQRGSSEERDEISADWKEDKDDIDMQDLSGTSRCH